MKPDDPRTPGTRSLPPLTRRALVTRAAGALAATVFVGIDARPARADRRFPGADQFDVDVATTWFDQALELVKQTAGFSPPVASRVFGYSGLALYEALVPGMEGYRSLGGVLPSSPILAAAGRNEAYDWPTVANATLASILRNFFASAPAEQLAALNAREARVADRLRPGVPPG